MIFIERHFSKSMQDYVFKNFEENEPVEIKFRRKLTIGSKGTIRMKREIINK